MTRELGDLAAVAHRFRPGRPGMECPASAMGDCSRAVRRSSARRMMGVGLAEAIGRAVIALQDGRRP